VRELVKDRQTIVPQTSAWMMLKDALILKDGIFERDYEDFEGWDF
jgi:hypothetical protein